MLTEQREGKYIYIYIYIYILWLQQPFLFIHSYRFIGSIFNQWGEYLS